MMRFGYDMMGWTSGGSLLFTFTWLVWLTVGVLAAIWLWKQIQK